MGERLIHHLGAQHGRPERHQRTHRGNTDEAEHVHCLVREQELRMQGAGQVRVGNHAAKRRTEGQQQRRNNVEANGHTEPRRQSLTHLLQQVDAVPGNHRTDNEGAHHGGGVEAGHAQLTDHADHEHENTGVQNEDASYLGAARFIWDFDLHERFGEVLRPNQNRVRNQAEGDNVHHQPAAIRDKPVQQKYADKGKHPVGDRLGGATMPRTATGCAACNLFGGEARAGHISRTRANAQAGGAASGDVCGLAARVLTFGWGAEMFTHVITAFTAGCSWTSVCGSAPGTPAVGWVPISPLYCPDSTNFEDMTCI